MQTVTLKGQDFTTIHNALCNLRRYEDDTKIAAIIEQFEKGLQDAYRQDNDSFNDKHDYFSGIAEENDFISIWSKYDVDSMYDSHGFGDNVKVRYNGHEYPVQSFTWLDVWYAAEQVIKMSDDSDHIFIEDFIKEGDTLTLVTGS